MRKETTEEYDAEAFDLCRKQRTLMAGKWQKNFTEGTSGAKVDDLLHVSSLQRLARERIVEMQASSSRRRSANTSLLQSHDLLPAWHISRTTFCILSTNPRDSVFVATSVSLLSGP